MWQTKYAWAVPKNLGLGLTFWPYSENPYSAVKTIFSLGVRSPCFATLYKSRPFLSLSKYQASIWHNSIKKSVKLIQVCHQTI